MQREQLLDIESVMLGKAIASPNPDIAVELAARGASDAEISDDVLENAKGNVRIIAELLELLPEATFTGKYKYDALKSLKVRAEFDPESPSEAYKLQANVLWAKNPEGSTLPWYVIGQKPVREGKAELLLATPEPAADSSYSVQLPMGEITSYYVPVDWKGYFSTCQVDAAEWSQYREAVSTRKLRLGSHAAKVAVPHAIRDYSKGNVQVTGSIFHRSGNVEKRVQSQRSFSLRGAALRLVDISQLTDEFISLYDVPKHLGLLAAEFGKETEYGAVINEHLKALSA